MKRRSLSPGAEGEGGNKRPAILCEYFVKGWCIKGSSCRFLHKTDHGNLVEEGILPAKSEFRSDRGCF